jgi:azurin
LMVHLILHLPFKFQQFLSVFYNRIFFLTLQPTKKTTVMKLSIQSIFSFLLILAFTGTACGPAEERVEETEEEEVVEEAPVTEDEDVEHYEITVRTTGETMQDMAFDTDMIIVSPGARVHVTLINEAESAAMEHNIVFIKAGTAQDIMEKGLAAGRDNDFIPKDHPDLFGYTPIAKPGETVEGTFTAPTEPGNYEFVCLYPGHINDMKGDFIVR